MAKVESVKINGISPAPFDFNLDKCTDRRKYMRSYGTCRNWQFATLYGHIFDVTGGTQ